MKDFFESLFPREISFSCSYPLLAVNTAQSKLSLVNMQIDKTQLEIDLGEWRFYQFVEQSQSTATDMFSNVPY